LTIDAWITIAILAIAIALMVTDTISPPEGIIGATIALTITGVITFDEAFSGFASTAAITVGAYYVVAAAIEKTGALLPVLPHLLGRGRRPRLGLARLTIPAGAASGFVSNTPIVAMMIDPIRAWSRRTGVPASKVLIPLSYATILGGTITLIGTSTNLLVSDLFAQSGGEEFDFFTTAVIGLPVAITGLMIIILLAPLLLPARGAGDPIAAEELRTYAVSVVVEEGGPLEGSTLRAGRLDHIGLVALEREGRALGGADAETELRGGDRLTFLARADDVVELQRARGLSSTMAGELEDVSSVSATFYEAVVSAESPLVGTTIREADFPDTYGAAPLALHRSGRRIRSRDVADMTLRPGDAVLVVAPRGFREAWRNRSDFLVVNRLGGPSPTATSRAPIALLVTLGVVVLAGVGLLGVAEAALLGAAVLVGTRTVTFGESLSAINWGVVLMIGSAFGIGAAVEGSGLATDIADLLVSALGGLGDAALVLGLLLAAMVLTELVSNSAAAVLVLPIALSVADEVGLDPKTTAIGVAVAASCSFVTPIGYQTNTMVMGPGSYRFTDYARLGGPLAAVVLVTITVLVLLLSA
jgi:di/tricarboxylate transporter